MQPTARVEEVHVTQRPSVFPARGDWLGRLDSRAGGGHQSRRRTLSSNHELLRSWKWWLRTADRPPAEWKDQDKTNHCTPYPRWPYRLTYDGMVFIPWNARWWQYRAPNLKGAHLLRLVRQIKKRRQQTNSLSSHPETSTVLLVFTQWSAEGLGKKKPKLQEFLKREGVDVICIQGTHLTDTHCFTLRGY